MAEIILSRNPEKVYLPSSNTDHTINFDNVLGQDDFNGTIKVDNITSNVRFNIAGAVDVNFSAVYGSSDTGVYFDARRGMPLHVYGASGAGMQITVFNS